MKKLNDIPVTVEIEEVEHDLDNVLSVDELSDQIEAARKGTARVDSKYVGNAQGLRHLFDYNLNYARFLDNIQHVIKAGKARREEDRYKNPHKMRIQ